MAIRDKILAALGKVDRVCDDCLSEMTGVMPRQAININCRELASKRAISRPTESCARCARWKRVNVLPSGVARSPAPEPVQKAMPIATGRDMRHRCYLVSCVGSKRPSVAKAKDLYVSDWFLKARAYVERADAPWFILSAEHGLLDPDTPIEPYEKTLNLMGVAERRKWAQKVIGDMNLRLPAVGEIVVFAGARYREFLVQYLAGRAERVVVPLEGLRIGEQLSWLNSH
jgi:hypothetical protein